MARPFTTTRSLESLQPRKEPRHGHGRRIAAGSQEVGRDTGAQGQRQAFGDPRGRRVPVACRENVLLAAAGAVRCEARHRAQISRFLSRPRWRKLDINKTLRGQLLQLEVREGVFVYIIDATLITQAGKKTQNTFSTGNRQRRPRKRTPLRQEQTRPQELPQLHDRPLDHAVGHPDSLLQAVSHARVLQADWLETPHHSRGGSDLIRELPLPEGAKVIVLGDTAYDSEAVRDACRDRGYRWIFPATPSAFWLARKGSGPRCVRS